MPISKSYAGISFDSDHTDAMGHAFEKVKAALAERGFNRCTNESIAQFILGLAEAGETNPDRRAEMTLELFAEKNS